MLGGILVIKMIYDCVVGWKLSLVCHLLSLLYTSIYYTKGNAWSNKMLIKNSPLNSLHTKLIIVGASVNAN